MKKQIEGGKSPSNRGRGRPVEKNPLKSRISINLHKKDMQFLEKNYGKNLQREIRGRRNLAYVYERITAQFNDDSG